MQDPVDFIGLVAIGAALAVPLAYGLSTLLGMTHKQFRPIFHARRPNGSTTPVVDGPKEPPAEQQNPEHEQPRREPW